MGNRDALLEAAVVCISGRGYGATTARDVAGEAGVSLGAIRYHFGSLEQLLNEAIGECTRRWVESFRRAVGGRAASDPRAGLAAMAEGLYDVFETQRPLFAGYIEAFARAQHSEQTRAQLSAQYAEFHASMAAVVRSAFGGTDDDSHAAAAALMALADGLMIQWWLEPGQPVAPAALRRIAHGVVTSATSPDANT